MIELAIGGALFVFRSAGVFVGVSATAVSAF